MPFIHELVASYLEDFGEERERLRLLTEFLQKNSALGLITRTNEVGHITASGVVVDPTARKVLQIFHPSLKRFLLPGGHIEAGDANPREAAIREIQEETGLKDLLYVPFHYNPEIPIDIDTHLIPGIAGFPAHYHHDFRYVFVAPEGTAFAPGNGGEIERIQWVGFEALDATVTFVSLSRKLERLLSRELRQRRFYDRICDRVLLGMRRRLRSIVITHLLPDTLEYLNAVERLSSVDLVIPKPRSKDKEVQRLVSSKFRIEELSRDPSAGLLNGLKKSVSAQETEPLVLFDIGGWFAPIIHDLKDWLGERLLGVVEDTENGHQKYQRLASTRGLPVPVVSVARSPLKDSEDFLVGQSVVFSADVILRENGRLIEYLDCAVLGFGKIGSSIAQHLLLRGIKPRVFDNNPIRRATAHNRLGRIPPLDEMLAGADVLFSATGSQGLSIVDFRKLKKGCFVFSVTSSDDEFNLDYVMGEYAGTEVRPNVKRLASATNYFHLVNEGNAVNFLHNAVIGEFINLVRAEMLWACWELEQGRLECGLHEVADEVRRQVAEDWLEVICNGGKRALM